VFRLIAILLAAVTTVPPHSLAQSPLATSSPVSERPLTIKIERAVVTLIDDNKVPATEVGMLTALTVKEGDSIDKDAPLARIDDRETLAKQRIAQSELEAALAQAANEAELEVAQKAKDVSLAELEQYREIRQKSPGAVSLSELRKYEFQYDKSIAQEKQAINEKEIARLTAGAKQAQLDATAVELDQRQIKAPFKGQVVEIYKHPGDWVQAGEAIMHIVGLDKVRVMGTVPAKDASSAEVLGKPVTIMVHSSGGKQHTVKGIINFASPVIEGHGEHRDFRVFAEVPNEVLIDPVTKLEAWKIQPGSFATMNIDLVGPPKPAPITRTDAKGSDSKGSKIQSFKPLTGSDSSKTDAERPETKSHSSTSKVR